MTPREALTQWLANGARRDDPVLEQAKASRIHSGYPLQIDWEVSRELLALARFSDGWSWVRAVRPHDVEAEHCLGSVLSPAFWAHLDRMTEGMS